MNWDGVSEFVAVVEAGSFTAASRRLGISTAQVSRQVSALEERLGTRLLYRTTRRVSMTEAGQVYYRHCRPLLDGLTEAEQAVTELQQVPRGLLRMTAPVTYGENIVAPLVNDFLARYPDLEVDLVLTNRRLDLVAEGVDLAIRAGQLEDSTMVARRLASRAFHVCASPEYLAVHGEPRTLADLDRHQCLRGTLDIWRFQEQGQPRQVRVQGRLHCNSGWALVDAALKGLGIVQLPEYYVQAHLDTGRLVPLLTPYQVADDGIWGLYPRTRHLSAKVRMMLDHLERNL
ncbi:LysR substrate-binding domain-containing protein [Marinobacter lutaoensis]|mgnify:CR=1 FL=1|uniref:LysR family transcriptional regulator n=1 Tax=Marinobacter lutaoensis TaxID=135739 RepID=A0A1V2DQY0_9GAMM|nr:LysR substrate-binding domain-containing protein [Marinobacter lutaoensis]MBE02792.1 LysR family transcriptional regulator [Marinobacter sp.]MBI44310.1 LysR family transcriptional regulator [Oceanospirillales bacterium]NVD36721.1 LysR family transcriptional regulator [Marinobacter lutaoensis]ONF43027.1 LysR family transcriptional regulator [Marinobacter lutaoensis]